MSSFALDGATCSSIGSYPGPSRDRLLERGYVIAPRVLDAAAIERCRALSARIIEKHSSPEYRKQHASIGSLFDLLEDPASIDLITWPRAFGVLGALGFPDARFQHGIVFSKPPRTPRTFWHQDGVSWNHPLSYDPVPHDLILIYYLIDTAPENGCLRVIPGSHKKRHVLHDWLSTSYAEDLRSMADAACPAFQSFQDEVSLAVSAGDVVILDARLLHSAHANQGESERTALSLWYATDVAALPEAVRARFTLDERQGSRLPYVPRDWPPSARRRLRSVLPPPYTGTEPPLPIDNNPGPRLS